MNGAAFLFAYLLPVLPVSVGAGLWFRDEPDARRAPGLLGFVSLVLGFCWPLTLPIAALAAISILFGEWVKGFRR